MVVDDRDRLQAVGEDDVGVHRRHVDVVDQREGLVLVRRPHVPQRLQPPHHLRPDLLPVHRLLQPLLRHLHRDSEPQDVLHPLDQLLEGCGVEAEVRGEVGPVDSGAQALHLAAGVGLAVKQVALVVLVDVLELLVGEDDAALEGLGHEEVLAEGAAALAEDLVGEHGDDGGEGEDEAVDVLHVEEVGGHCVGDRVLREPLRVVLRQPHHLLGVDLDRVVAQLRLRHRFQSPRALREEGVALDPAEAVEVRSVAAVELAALVGDAELGSEAEEVELHAALEVGVVELVAVVGGDDVRVVALHKAGEPQQQVLLGGLVEDGHVARELGLRLVVELLHRLPAEPHVHHQERLALVHQAHHHDLVLLRVRELQRVLRRLDVERQDLQLGHAPLPGGRPEPRDQLVLEVHLEPLARAQPGVDADARVEGHVELADAGDEVGDIARVTGLASAVEGVIVIVLAFAAFVEQALERVLGVGEITHSAEVDLEVLLAAPREVVHLLQVRLLLHFDRLHLLQLRLQVRLHLLLRPLREPHVEVRPVGQQALHQLAVLALEEAEHCHALLVVVEPVAVGLGLEVREEAEDAARAVVEPHAHLLLELLALVPSLVLHLFAPIILCMREPKLTTKQQERAEGQAEKRKHYQLTVVGNSAGVFFEVELAEALRERYRLAAKSLGKRWERLRQPIRDVGLSNSSKNHADFLQPPFLLDPFAVFFLHSRPEILEKEGIKLQFASQEARLRLQRVGECREAAVYLQLAGRYFLLDGHKFGCAFLAYDGDPEVQHAKALVFVGEEREEWVSRLAGIAKKEGWRAGVGVEGQVQVKTVRKHQSRKHEQLYP